MPAIAGDYARVDIRLDAQGAPYVLEINSMASLGSSGSYVTAARAAGYSFAKLVDRIVSVAQVRYFRHRLRKAAVSVRSGECMSRPKDRAVLPILRDTVAAATMFISVLPTRRLESTCSCVFVRPTGFTVTARFPRRTLLPGTAKMRT